MPDHGNGPRCSWKWAELLCCRRSIRGAQDQIQRDQAGDCAKPTAISSGFVIAATIRSCGIFEVFNRQFSVFFSRSSFAKGLTHVAVLIDCN
jgi:hypothetical protein